LGTWRIYWRGHFFVISGFLISKNLLESLIRGNFSIKMFYVRRIKRIFPALIIVMSTCFAIGWFSLLADEYQQLGKHIAGGAAFISNIILWNEAGYFDIEQELKPLLHLWSLGIEEQYYIVWPIILFLGWKFTSKLFLIILLLLLSSFALNIVTISSFPVEAFYSLLTRFWELAIGGILAFLVLFKNDALTDALGKNGRRNFISFIGLSLIIASLGFNKNLSFPGWWALMPTAGTFYLDGFGSRLPTNIFNLETRSIYQPKSFDLSNPRKNEPACLEKFAFGLSFCFVEDVVSPPTVVILGDSHAGPLWWGMTEFYFEEKENVLTFGYGGCIPFRDVASNHGGCASPINKSLNYILETPNIHTVVLTSMGPTYITNYSTYADDDPRSFKLAEIFGIEMNETIQVLLKAKKKVIYVADNPELGFKPRSCVRPVSITTWANEACVLSRDVFEKRNALYLATVKSVLKEHPSVKLLESSKYLCGETYCYAKKHGIFWYHDENHLSVEGALYVGKKFALERALEKTDD